ncbi:MAG: branched-chain amino acid ABC transporter substrate-binding protein [Actinomycetota bacterium]
MKKRWFALLAILLALSLMASACGGDADDDGRTFEPGALGAVTIGSDEPLEIGAIQAVSGDVASLGEDQVRAIEIAIDDLDGEFRGHPIELSVEDGQCAAEGGTTAAQALVSNPQIVGIIGTSCSGAGVPVSEIMSEADLTMISGSNTSPALTSLQGEEGDAYNPGYFRTAHNDEIQGAAAATFVYEELDITEAASIHDGDPYTQGLVSVFDNSFEEFGGTISLSSAVSPDQTDMRPVLTEVEASGAELLFFPIFQPAGDFIARQAGDVGFGEEILMGADGLLSDTFVSIPATEGMYFSGPGTPEGNAYSEFVSKYEAEYGERPIQSFHAHAYDAANILFQGLDEIVVEDDDGTLHIDRQGLRDAVGETEGFEGLTGVLSCDEFGDCADPNIQVFQNTEEKESIDDVRGDPLYTFDEEAAGL